MKREMDKLILESRSEVDQLEGVLREWLDDHPEAPADQREMAEQAAHLLEVLWYEW